MRRRFVICEVGRRCFSEEEEQIFGGFNWDEPTLEQTWEEMYFVGAE